MISSLSGIALPITAKLNPRVQANWLYMAKSAVLTRLAIAGMRTWQNVPTKNKNPQSSPLEKYQSLWERFFIEILGTTGYMLAMHLGQDMMTKILEASPTLDPNKVTEGIVGLSHREGQLLQDTVRTLYGENSKGIIARVLYGKANLANVYKTIEKAIEKDSAYSTLINNQTVRDALEKFASKLNWRASLTLLAGIAAGVGFGGIVVQFVNDRFFGPVVEPFLARLFGLDNNSTTRTTTSNSWVAFDDTNRPLVQQEKQAPLSVNLSDVARTYIC